MDIKNNQLRVRWCNNEILIDTLAEAIDIAKKSEMPILEVFRNGKWIEFYDDKDRTLEDIMMSIMQPEKDMWISGEKYVFCTRCCEMMKVLDVEQDIDFEDGLPHATYVLECPICKMQTVRRSDR